jgi:flagellar hook protein FlgE
MLRSMFAGVSGLRAHQTMMDVVGNNIANVNTTGYKASRTTFGDTLSQMQRGGASGGPAGTAGPGGINAQQVGLGVKVGAIDTVNSQGATQITNRATDIAIQNEGYFVVDAGQGQTFTRAGAFSPDEQGRLTDISGYVLQGYQIGTDGTVGTALSPMQFQIGQAAPDGSGAQLKSYAIGNDGTISGVFSDGNTRPLARIALATFSNPGGLVRDGDNHLRADVNSGAAQIGVPGDVGKGTLAVGALEMSNVDLAAEFTNLIIAQRGFQANSRIITASDEILQDLVNLKR